MITFVHVIVLIILDIAFTVIKLVTQWILPESITHICSLTACYMNHGVWKTTLLLHTRLYKTLMHNNVSSSAANIRLLNERIAYQPIVRFEYVYHKLFPLANQLVGSLQDIMGII